MQKQWNAETGITGELGGFAWEVFFNHSTSELSVTNPNNTDNAKYLASLDAVNDARHHQVLGLDTAAVCLSLSRLRSVEHHGSRWHFGGGL